jgi:hypothetical protein
VSSSSLLEELRVRLGQHADFRRLNYSQAVVDHYVAVLNGSNQNLKPQEFFDAVF